MVLTFDPNDFEEEVAGFAGMVGVMVFTGGAPEMATSAFDEGPARRL